MDEMTAKELTDRAEAINNISIEIDTIIDRFLKQLLDDIFEIYLKKGLLKEVIINKDQILQLLRETIWMEDIYGRRK